MDKFIQFAQNALNSGAGLVGNIYTAKAAQSDARRAQADAAAAKAQQSAWLMPVVIGGVALLAVGAFFAFRKT